MAPPWEDTWVSGHAIHVRFAGHGGLAPQGTDAMSVWGFEQQPDMACTPARGGLLATRDGPATRPHAAYPVPQADPGPAPSPRGLRQAARNGVKPVGRGRVDGPSGPTVTEMFDRCR